MAGDVKLQRWKYNKLGLCAPYIWLISWRVSRNNFKLCSSLKWHVWFTILPWKVLSNQEWIRYPCLSFWKLSIFIKGYPPHYLLDKGFKSLSEANPLKARRTTLSSTLLIIYIGFKSLSEANPLKARRTTLSSTLLIIYIGFKSTIVNRVWPSFKRRFSVPFNINKCFWKVLVLLVQSKNN